MVDNLVDVLLDLLCHRLAGCAVYEHASYLSSGDYFSRALEKLQGSFENLLYKNECTSSAVLMFLTDQILKQPRGSSHSEPVGMRGECRGLQCVFNYGESLGQAHLVLHSQAAVRAHSKARAMLQWDNSLDRRKGS